jgi:UDP-N-acetylglucosamine acyltransferase
MSISNLSVIHPEAKIGEGVTIGPFCFIDKNTRIGDGTWIGPNVSIFEGARIGNHCTIYPGAVISAVPQDLKFRGEITTTEIGDHTSIREYVSINRGTAAAGKTVVGSHCLIMAYVHVAHDCILGDHVILANTVNLAGHVEIEDWAILEGLVAVQQFTRIGAHSFIAGGSKVRKHVPPFVKAAREPLSYVGINTVGLRRRAFSDTQIKRIEDIYRVLFVRGYTLSKAMHIIEYELPPSEEKNQIMACINVAEGQGIMKGFRSLNGVRAHED